MAWDVEPCADLQVSEVLVGGQVLVADGGEAALVDDVAAGRQSEIEATQEVTHAARRQSGQKSVN